MRTHQTSSAGLGQFSFQKLMSLGLLLLTGAALSLTTATARAEDIDIYSGLTVSGDRSNVLIIWDNTANWGAQAQDNKATCSYADGTGAPSNQGTKYALELCAMYNVVHALQTNPDDSGKYNLAIMMFNESGGGATGNGAYPRLAFTEVSKANKDNIKKLIKNLDIGGDKGSNSDYGAAMYEAYLYFKGKKVWNGKGTPSKYDGKAFNSDGTYKSPSFSTCAKNFIVFIGNGPPNSTNYEGDISNLVAGKSPYSCTDSGVVQYGPSAGAVDVELGKCAPTAAQTKTAKELADLKSKISYEAINRIYVNWADELSRLLSNIDVSGNDGKQGVTTFAAAVLSLSSTSDGQFPELMNSVAAQGGTTKALQAKNANDLALWLQDAFNNMQAINSVFTSASLPVSVNSRGTYLNQVYMGMFRPDDQARPRWSGNVKQYKFSYNPTTASIYLSDTLGNEVASASTGFINTGVVSAWTTDSTFWQNNKMGTPESGSDRPDGEVVEKGGAAQRLRETYATSRDARKVYTCVGAAACAKDALLGSTAAGTFDASNPAITDTLLNITANDTTAGLTKADIINWVRGDDNKGDEKGPGAGVTVRPSIHGDVLHSRPAVVNYGGSVGVVVFYGTNGGTFHAIRGGDPSMSAGGGQEFWSFVPEEALGKLKRLRANDPKILLSTTPATLIDRKPRDYTMDGPIGVYQYINASGVTEKARIYVGMRRGGRAVYAFDVSDPTRPKFQWKRTNADNSGDTGDWSKLGQTWSEPKLAWVKGVSNPVLIMGAGYDADAEDVSPPGTTTMGNAVLIIDSVDGKVLKVLPTDRSVAADVTLMDTDVDGKIDRAYAVDVGGNIYRIDFETDTAVDASVWGIYKLANMNSGSTYQRKFFYPVDVVQAPSFVAVLGGTGDREKPLTQTTSDAFFTIYDTTMGKKPATAPDPITTATMVPIGSTSTTKPDGCYLNLNVTGEKVVNAATTALGYTYFATNRPMASSGGTSCLGSLGEAKIYSIPLFCDAAYSSDVVKGGGLPPSPVTGFVTIQYQPPIGDPVEKNVAFIIGAPNTKHSAIEGSKIVPKIPMVRRKSYWYVEGQK